MATLLGFGSTSSALWIGVMELLEMFVLIPDASPKMLRIRVIF
jgi:hypothetical protein